jgi:hypothetical protein
MQPPPGGCTRSKRVQRLRHCPAPAPNIRTGPTLTQLSHLQASALRHDTQTPPPTRMMPGAYDKAAWARRRPPIGAVAAMLLGVLGVSAGSRQAIQRRGGQLAVSGLALEARDSGYGAGWDFWGSCAVLDRSRAILNWTLLTLCLFVCACVRACVCVCVCVLDPLQRRRVCGGLGASPR